MASKALTVGVGIPMIIVGALMAWLWAPYRRRSTKSDRTCWEHYWYFRSCLFYIWVVLFKRTCYALETH